MLVCGGSAGHINPAIATADALRKLMPDCAILFVGAGRAMEKRLVPQAGLNISVVTNFLPCTGISLPFFSYGGSALAIQLAEMGILLSISRDIPATKAG